MIFLADRKFNSVWTERRTKQFFTLDLIIIDKIWDQFKNWNKYPNPFKKKKDLIFFKGVLFIFQSFTNTHFMTTLLFSFFLPLSSSFFDGLNQF